MAMTTNNLDCLRLQTLKPFNLSSAPYSCVVGNKIRRLEMVKPNIVLMMVAAETSVSACILMEDQVFAGKLRNGAQVEELVSWVNENF